jgi:RNA polymerase sigma factor (sigma-70 family)
LDARADQFQRSGALPADDPEFMTRLLKWIKDVTWAILLGARSATRDYEDVAQRAVMKVTWRFKQFRGDSRFTAWAWRIVEHEVTDFHRQESRDREKHCSTDDPVTQSILNSAQVKRFNGGVIDTVDNGQDFEQLLSRLLSSVPRPVADIIAYKLDGLTSNAIAKKMGSPAGTVRSALSRAMRRIGFSRAVKRASRNKIKPADRKPVVAVRETGAGAVRETGSG